MKKILITGENSYIGGKFKEWVEQWPDEYEVDEISVRGDEWKKADFSSYDTVLHVAGIAHRRETKKNRDLYYKINRDLAVEVSEKAKAEGVKQFIFLSTMSVYGLEKGKIDENTPTKPKKTYGQSKLEAEKLITELETDDFKVVILRPPMVYGEGCKGNYPLLSKVAQITPIFPDYDNHRSMLHIDNLTEFIRLIIENNDFGIFFPQNEEYIKTSDMVRIISGLHNKKMFQTKLFNPIIEILTKVNLVNKVFGNLVYEKTISEYRPKYYINDLEDSLLKTEG